MKKMKKLVLLFLLVCSLQLTGCVDIESIEKSIEKKTEYAQATTSKVLMSNISEHVYTFKDMDTGVWYISTGNGITPRLNTDGSLYVD